MATDHRAALREIKTFPQLVAYLRDAMNWPIDRDSFEDVDDLFYDYTAEELGIDAKNSAKIRKIKRLRPLTANQPWGIFFVEFEPKKLPVVALRRILGQVVLKTRTSANAADRSAWNADDLLFISNYGEGEERQITFAHFSQPQGKSDLPALKVLGWDNLDTAGHLDHVARELTEHLSWPDDDTNSAAWRDQWRSAFTLGHREVITTSKQLSIALAKLAKNIRDRINAALKVETERGPLTKLMNAFRESLLHDLKPDDFADMYAQTIAYGLLSARIADPESKTADDFARHMRTNPFLRELMETFLHVGGRRGKRGDSAIDFDELGVNDVVELLDRANMAAVVADFGDKNPQEDPVIHFYELFLKEYDAKKRMQRGVFYTPRPVVSYIVRSVDQLLRTEFGLEDGLADTTTWGEMAERNKDLKIPEGTAPEQPFVQILDPACGTGTFLVQVIDVIHRTLTEKWSAAGHPGERRADLWNEYVAAFLLPRLHGWELLMAPYAIAHLKIGLKLHDTGYDFGTDERARIFLTNALEPASDTQFRLSAMPALAHEAEAVNRFKRDNRFTVVIGNPPYSCHSSNKGGWIAALLRDYYFVGGAPLGERNPKWLQDDYVKFIRLAQHLLGQSRIGILGYITNHSYSDNPTFRGMRRSLMLAFSDVLFLDLHGNSKKGERPPDNSIDDNVFDIQQGVAILIAIQNNPSRVNRPRSATRHADAWGARADKYSTLTNSAAALATFDILAPSAPSYLFVPQDTALRSEVDVFQSVTEIFPINNMGVTTGDDETYVAFSAKELFVGNSHDDTKIMKFAYRPFDERIVYYDPKSLARGRFEFMRNMVERRNIALVTIRRPRNQRVANFFVSDGLIDKGFISSLDNCQVFPLFTVSNRDRIAFANDDSPNLSQSFLKRLAATLGVQQVERGGLPAGLSAESILYFAYAVFHSPAYRTRYKEFLKTEFPRLPLTESWELFHELARLGGELIALHLLESPQLANAVSEFVAGRNHEVERSLGPLTASGSTRHRALAFQACPKTSGTSTLAATRSAKSG